MDNRQDLADPFGPLLGRRIAPVVDLEEKVSGLALNPVRLFGKAGRDRMNRQGVDAVGIKQNLPAVYRCHARPDAPFR